MTARLTFRQPPQRPLLLGVPRSHGGEAKRGAAWFPRSEWVVPRLRLLPPPSVGEARGGVRQAPPGASSRNASPADEARRILAVAQEEEGDGSSVEAAPRFTIHCTELSTYRSMDFTLDGALVRTPATAATPPQIAFGSPTRTRTISGLARNFARELYLTATPNEFLETNRAQILLDTGHLRVDPRHATRFQVRLRGLICYPTRGAGTSELPRDQRFPVAIVVHGQHANIDVTLADSGRPRHPVVRGGVTYTLIPARATLSHEVMSYRGYEYLQEHLAARGIVSVSIDCNAANAIDSLIDLRADLVMEMLSYLRSLDADSTSPFHRRLDFDRVALVGHSRGGDAVVQAAELNRNLPATSKYGIRAVVALAPTDFTGLSPVPSTMRSNRTASFLCVYGSHDGDVSGAFHPVRDRGQAWTFAGTGFRHYDRATTQRAMVFIHGATHNRFNRVWVDPRAHAPGSPAHTLAQSEADGHLDVPHVDPRLPPSSAWPLPPGHRDARVLSSTDHQALAQEYIGGWLSLWLRGQFSEQQRFVGAHPNSLGSPVGLQWKLGRSLRGIDQFDNAASGANVLGGAVTSPAFVTEQLIELSNLPHCPHHDRTLQATAPSGTNREYRTTIPVGKRDWTNFTALTFRVAKHFPNLTLPTAIASPGFPPRVQVGLFDGTVRKAVGHATIASLNPTTVRPYHRMRGAANLTKVHLQTWQIPLSRFTGVGGVSLRSIQAVEITFDAGPGEPIFLDTLSLVRL